MTEPPPLSFTDATLQECATLGLRAGRVVARVMEIEQQVAEAVTVLLPRVSRMPADATAANLALRLATQAGTAMAAVSPRVMALAEALEVVARSVRRSLALAKRIESGWPAAKAQPDDRTAMVRRQVERGVAEAIRRAADGEKAERLFADLAERLDDPGFEAEIAATPAKVVEAQICRELGLAVQAVKTAVEKTAEATGPAAAEEMARVRELTEGAAALAHAAVSAVPFPHPDPLPQSGRAGEAGVGAVSDAVAGVDSG